MTDFKPYPETAAVFPETSKVSGIVRLVFHGNGRMGLMTDGGARISFRGDDTYTVHVSLQHNDETGRVEVRDYVHLKRGMWADVPPTYARAILAACEDLATSEWSSLLDRQGLEADVAQNLNRLERMREDLSSQLAEVSDRIQQQHERL